MKLNKYDAIVLLGLYLTTLYLYQLPVSDKPFGEVDASAHYGIGDYMGMYDKPIISMPHYMRRYYNANEYRPKDLWYPPQYHTNLAIAHVFGGERVRSIFLFVSIISPLIIISIYFLLRKLYGFWSAFLASLFLMFSIRDYITHVWGQWPSLLSFSMIPIVIYAYYTYFNSLSEGKANNKYLWVIPFLLTAQFLIHPVGTFHSLIYMGLYSALVMIKKKRFIFGKREIKKIVSVFLIFFVLISISAPFQLGGIWWQVVNYGFKKIVDKEDRESITITKFQPKHLIEFTPVPVKQGYPEFWYDNGYIYGKWILPFLFIGLLFLLVRREERDLLMLSWYFGLYFFLHVLLYIYTGRYLRSFIDVSHLYYVMMALGIVYAFNLVGYFVKIPKNIKLLGRYALVIFAIIMVLSVSAKSAYPQLKDAYKGIVRLSNEQIKMLDWLKENTHEEANIQHTGAISMAKTRWLRNYGMRFIFMPEYTQKNLPNHNLSLTHVIMDYTDYALTGGQEAVNQLMAYEQFFLGNKSNATLMYDKDNIRVYKYGTE